jgi:hypothetical protein
MIDRQQQLVYDWENRIVAPLDKTIVSFDNIKQIVNYVWQDEGLEYPPLVERLPPQTRRKCGDATRTKIRFQEATNTWIILHELAHAMSATHDHRSNLHGALFMGLYLRLLQRYLKVDLIDSVIASGIVVTKDAKPVFV